MQKNEEMMQTRKTKKSSILIICLKVLIGIIAVILGFFAGYTIVNKVLKMKDSKEFEGFAPATYECTIDITGSFFRQMMELPENYELPDSISDFRSEITITISLYEDGTGYEVLDTGKFIEDFTNLVTDNYLDFMQLIVESWGDEFDRNAKDRALANKNAMMKAIKEDIIDSLNSTSCSIGWKRYGYTLLLEENDVYTEYTLSDDWSFNLTDMADAFGIESVTMERIE